MKQKILVVLTALLLAGMLVTGGCGTFVWDPTGGWTFSMTFPGYGYSWTENLTFSGSDASGTVSGLTFGGMVSPKNGTYTKTGDYGITINFDFMYYSYHEVVNLTGTSTEETPNNLTGSGTWQENGWSASVTWTATKTSNLQ